MHSMKTSTSWCTVLVLERADQLASRAIADVDEPLVRVTAERTLRHPSVGRSIEDAAPALELADAFRRLPRVQLGHAPVVQVLAAEEGVLEVDPPAVVGVHVPERGRHAAFRHDRVRLPEERLRDDRRPGSGFRGGDRGPEAGTTRADDDHVVLVLLDLRGHRQKILGSSNTPAAASRM